MSGIQAGLTRMGAMGTKMRATGRAMSTYLTLPLVGVGFMAIKTAAAFDKSIAQVGIATGLGGRRLEEMRAVAIKFGKDTIFSANEAAEAMLELSKAGISAAQIKAGALAATLDLAAAGGQDLATSAVQIGAAMNTFNISAGKSRVIADALAGGANRSSANLSDLALSLQQAGQQAVASRLSLFETVGVLAAFADQGIRGSDAGTSLKVFLQRLNPVTIKAEEQMNKLGISFFDSNGRMKDMMGIAAELKSGLSGLNQKARLHAMQVMFGTDAMRAANIVYSLGSKELAGYIAATKRKGEAERMANAQMEGLPGALERLRGSLETAALKAGEAATPAIIGLAGAIEGLADAFTTLPPETQTAIVAIAGVALAAGPTLWVLGAMATAVAKLGRPLVALAGWFSGVSASAATTTTTVTAAQAAILAGGPSWQKRALESSGIGTTAGTSAGKSFARSMGGALGPAIAAIGLGNIVISATEGDWEQAGFKAGGAAAGGVIGGLIGSVVPGVGTAIGAMVGGGAGSFLGPMLADLIKGEKEVTPLQEKLARSSREVGRYFAESRRAASNLKHSISALSEAHRQANMSSKRLSHAQERVNMAVRKYGPNSRAAIAAEFRMVEAKNRNIRASNRLENIDRKHGLALQFYKQVTNAAALEIRNRVHNLRQQLGAIQDTWIREKKMGASRDRLTEISQKGIGIEKNLHMARDKQNKLLNEASNVAGPKYARFLQKANRGAIEAGGALKRFNDRLKTTLELTQGLSETDPFATPNLGNFGRGIPKGPGIGRPQGALGWRNFGGGIAEVGESGRELVFLPRGSDVMPAGPARRWQPESLLKQSPQEDRRYRRDNVKRPIQIMLGPRVLAEAMVDVQEDEEARL